MSNATLLNIIAAGHAMSHGNKKEAWTCDCLACKFTKEYKLAVHNDDGTIEETTVAEALIETLKQQGYEIPIAQPIS